MLFCTDAHQQYQQVDHNSCNVSCSGDVTRTCGGTTFVGIYSSKNLLFHCCILILYSCSKNICILLSNSRCRYVRVLEPLINNSHIVRMRLIQVSVIEQCFAGESIIKSQTVFFIVSISLLRIVNISSVIVQ